MKPLGYSVVIVDKTTGERRTRRMCTEWHESSHFWWTDGNFGCDCNRELEFRRAGGEEPDEEAWDALKCGHERFYVPLAILDDGREVEIDPLGEAPAPLP